MIKDILGFNVKVSYKDNMRNIKFRFDNGILMITCPKISDKKIEEYIKKNYDLFKKYIEESIKVDNYTYIKGVKYNIVNTNEIYNNIVFNDNELIITKGFEEKLLKELFINDVEKYILSKYDEFKNIFNIEMPKFIVKKLKSSYGQYNKTKHTITLDYRLAKYERIYLYLTFAHEMCHIIHFDHSKEFYDLLDTFVPNSKQMHKIMRKIKYDDIF